MGGHRRVEPEASAGDTGKAQHVNA